jgi:hypothetical protein
MKLCTFHQLCGKIERMLGAGGGWIGAYLGAHEGAFFAGRAHIDLAPSVFGIDEAVLIDVPLPKHLAELVVLLHALCNAWGKRLGLEW